MLNRTHENVRDVPFMKNDMLDPAPTMDKPTHAADAPGRADSEIADGVTLEPEEERAH